MIKLQLVDAGKTILSPSLFLEPCFNFCILVFTEAFWKLFLPLVKMFLFYQLI